MCMCMDRGNIQRSHLLAVSKLTNANEMDTSFMWHRKWKHIWWEHSHMRKASIKSMQFFFRKHIFSTWKFIVLRRTFSYVHFFSIILCSSIVVCSSSSSSIIGWNGDVNFKIQPVPDEWAISYALVAECSTSKACTRLLCIAATAQLAPCIHMLRMLCIFTAVFLFLLLLYYIYNMGITERRFCCGNMQ